MERQIVNPDPTYAPITLLEPATRGGIHRAAEATQTTRSLLKRLSTGDRKE